MGKRKRRGNYPDDRRKKRTRKGKPTGEDREVKAEGKRALSR
jgi:hypothetical protein